MYRLQLYSINIIKSLFHSEFKYKLSKRANWLKLFCLLFHLIFIGTIDLERFSDSQNNFILTSELQNYSLELNNSQLYEYNLVINLFPISGK